MAFVDIRGLRPPWEALPDGPGFLPALIEWARETHPEHVVEPPRRSHGDLAGYRWHYRHGDAPCDPCRKANAEHGRRFREARAS